MRHLRLLVLGVIFSVVATSLFAATTFTVDTNGDGHDDTIGDPTDTACLTPAGKCSLRAAIEQANKTGDTGAPYTVNFSAALAPPNNVIVQVNGTLPTITVQMAIDGTDTSQGFAFVRGLVMVELDGNGAGGDGLDIGPGGIAGANGSSVKGLVIRHHSSHGISIDANSVKVESCFIGTDFLGLTADKNLGDGILIFGANVTIGGNSIVTGNVISGNDTDGIEVSGILTLATVIQNNFIGTNSLGLGALGNRLDNLHITGSASLTAVGPLNVISGSQFGNGIVIDGGANLVSVFANHIGTDLPATGALPNAGDGINISGGTNHMIGGLTIGQRNVISGNAGDGVSILATATGVQVFGNFIGTDVTGTSAIPNGTASPSNGRGVFISANNNTVSAPVVIAPQVISGNTHEGVYVQGGVGNTISKNLIGKTLTGGVLGNGGAGVAVSASSNAGNQNLITQNKIANNGTNGSNATTEVGGIDLERDGITPNDLMDPDTGGNNLQNFPLFTSAKSVSGTTTVAGTLNSTPNTNVTIEFFTNPACDASGNGQGAIFDSSTNVTTDAAGNATFSVALSTDSPGMFVTSTATATSQATDPSNINNTSEFSPCALVVVPNADLVVTKTDSPDPVNAGTNITYTITLHNNGPDDAQTVSLTDNTPPNTTFVSFTGAPGYSCATPAVGGTGAILCTNATVVNGANDVFTLVVKVNSNVAAATLISNSATASSTTGDSAPANNTGTATTTVAVSSDLSVTKSDSPDPVNAGSNLTYTIQVTNNGPSDATVVQISDVVPANTTFVSSTTPAGFSCTTPAVGGTGTVTCNATSALAAGANVTVTMVVKVNASTVLPATITNTATVTSPTDTNNANDSAIATTTVAAQADLSITKTDAPDPVTAGNNVTYTITVTNNGPSDAAGVQISDPLPANTTFVSNTPSGNLSCINPAVGANGTVNCTATGPIAPAGTATMTIVAKVAASVANGATVTNTATATTTTPDPTTPNTATATTTVAASADVSVTKVDTPDPVAPGSNITYTITVANGGPSDAQGVTVTDTTPANTTFVSVTAPAYSCISPAVGGTGLITCNALAPLAAATNNQITVIVNVNPATPNATVITNSATASSTTADPAPGNNTGAATTTVNAVVLSADLSVTKSDSPDPVTAGMNLTYTITLSNAGPDPASTVSLTDALPAGTKFVSLASPGAYTCTPPPVGTNGTVTCTNPSVPVGGPDTFMIVVSTDPASGNGSTISNTATVSSTTTDPNNGNNSATATTTVATSADIAITKSDSPDPVAAGTNITYTITATNNGPSDAAGVSINDTTPANTTFVSATPAAGFSCTAPAVGGTGAISCSGGNILTGTAPTFQIVVNVNAATPNATIITNSATFTDATPDPNPANDTGTATTTVTAAATSADLSITKSDSPDPVAAGANITYTITVTNGGPNDATTVSMNDVVPANTTFVSVNAPVGYTCIAPAVGGTGPVTCTIPTLVNAAVSTFTLTVQVGAGVGNGTVISNTASVASATSDPTPGNNSATATTTVTAVVTSVDVSVSKTALPNPVNPGGNITYTVTVSNAGPGAAANVILTDTTPANTTFVSATMPAGYTCTSPVVGGTGTITCTNLSLASGATGTFTFVVKVGAATPNGTIISNTANVSTTSTDSNAGNNSATATTTVTVPVGSADLAITKTDSPDPVALGGIVTYTITVQNNGPNTATGVIVTDMLPAGASFSSASAGCTNNAGTVTCNLNSLLNAGSATVTIQAMATAGPTLTNTAQVTSNQTDPNLANNSATATTTVNASPNVPTASPFTLLLLALTLAAAGWFVSRK